MHARAVVPAAPETSERGWSIEQAAQRIGIGRSQTYELVASGELESITIGRRRIVPDSAIRAYFEARIAASRAARAGARS